ncbi:MAG: DUF4209 domain-containing protein [Spiribacter salinus]|uniref:DUF4209 domain-containing protein n=1 Tax=Spiribacter salinus TaxID=1335746 RepID=A0A540VM13_9GAMM|nr:MAG: DUF4209 domain-containing protein [Spiribacter salinus]
MNEQEMTRAVRDVLTGFDSEMRPIDENDVQSAIRKALPEDIKGVSLPREVSLESSGFAFCPDYNWDDWEDGGWNTYFGPETVWPNGDGTSRVSPSLSAVTEDDLDYWAQRSAAARHPVLAARYSSLCLDFSEPVCGRKFNYKIAQHYIDAAIDIADQKLHRYETDCFKILVRALSWAKKIGDSDRQRKLIQSMISFEHAVGENGKPGLWGYCFEEFVLDGKRTAADEDQVQTLVDDMERRLRETSADSKLDPWACKSAAHLLAKHYAQNNSHDDVRRVLIVHGEAFLKFSEGASAIQRHAWYEDVYHVYRSFGLNEEAQEMLGRLREAGKKTHEDMGVVEHRSEISKEDMDAYVGQFLKDSLEDSLVAYAAGFIHRRDAAIDEIKRLASSAPMVYMISRQLQDAEGRLIAKVGPLHDDIDGHVAVHISQLLQMAGIFMDAAITGIVDHFQPSAKDLAEFLFKCPLFADGRKGITELGLEHYMGGRDTEAIHLLIPEFEATIRRLIEVQGGVVVQPHRSGGFNYFPLDRLLRDPLVESAIGPDAALCLRVIMTDPRGLNLRNNICHALVGSDSFGRYVSNLVVNSMMLLSLVRPRENGSGSAG